MKKLRLLFLSLFIIGLIGTTASVAATISSTGTHTGTVANDGTTISGGALWTDGSTWQGGFAPVAGDNVEIMSGDLVYTGAVSFANVFSLTAHSGCSLLLQVGVSGTSGGTFKLESGSYWYVGYSSGTKVPGGFTTYSI